MWQVPYIEWQVLYVEWQVPWPNFCKVAGSFCRSACIFSRKTGIFKNSKNNLSVESKKLLSVKKNFGKKCQKTKKIKIYGYLPITF